jgi:hypothetical protein
MTDAADSQWEVLVGTVLSSTTCRQVLWAQHHAPQERNVGLVIAAAQVLDNLPRPRNPSL